EHEDEVRVLEGGVVAGREEVRVKPLGTLTPCRAHLVARLIQRRVHQLEHVLNPRRARAVAGPGGGDGEGERVVRRLLPDEPDGRRCRPKRERGLERLLPICRCCHVLTTLEVPGHGRDGGPSLRSPSVRTYCTLVNNAGLEPAMDCEGARAW